MQKKEAVPPTEVPETAATYERAQPARSLGGADSTPPRSSTPTSDQQRAAPLPAGDVPVAGSMKTEEPTGWDLAPNDIQDAERKRHPRPDGVGGSEHGAATQAERRPSELGG